jgi:hypothetical protein
LKNRVGGFVQYTDSAKINNPDPISTHYVPEADRFDKDFAVADKIKREAQTNTKDQKIYHLREERFQREAGRWDYEEKKEKFEVDRIGVRADKYQAGKKNQGGAAYNIVTLGYENTKDGQKL